MSAQASAKKRSRSPEEGDDNLSSQPTKRQNTGLPPSGSSSAFDVAMSDSQDVKPTTTTATHNPLAIIASSVELEKPLDLPAKPEAAVTENGQKAAQTAAPVPTIHMRCLILTQDASIIIGKAGSHVNEIREKSGAKVMVSESIPGNPERILNVSGPLDAVSKVCLILTFQLISY
jgi:poly(rC)-binding protein 2/3/4